MTWFVDIASFGSAKTQRTVTMSGPWMEFSVAWIATAGGASVTSVRHVRGRIATSTGRSSVTTSRALLTTIATRTTRGYASRTRITLGSHTRTSISLRLISVSATARARTTHRRLVIGRIAGHWVRGSSRLRSTLRGHGATVLWETISGLRLAIAWRLRLLRRILRLIKLSSWRTVFAPLERVRRRDHMTLTQNLRCT